ncbi:hypothetical protein C8N32_11928 [Rhodovulum imhoffii]|uniref:Glutathione S-transferase n=1 Tax=Rhodovulum imhoffii TaxID=365340 RepID=A0A2T5BPJ6_9RHOB|nr:MAPEG family protein [Rhodovulum imhoffii]MBK5932872.1 hypothetical protein [Rhodovulum imhoffii]PTN00971.1 hypothetical protein C8N32_11928 [Rhodovulum imhoffii]
MPHATPVYAGLLTLLYLYLSVRVVQRRASGKIFNGDGGDAEMARRMRVHANFNEYVPLGLVLLLLAEMQRAPLWLVHLLGLMLLAGRVLHAWGMSRPKQAPVGRGGGTVLTWGMMGLSALVVLAHVLFQEMPYG